MKVTIRRYGLTIIHSGIFIAWKEVVKLDIKKIDDKPMVIHTKKKSKLHIHESKKVQLKVRMSI